MSKNPTWDCERTKNMIWIRIWGKRFSSRRRKDICFRIKRLSMVTYKVMRDCKSSMIWCAKLTDFTTLQAFKERIVFKLMNMDFTKENRKNGFDYIHTRSWLDFVETLKIRSDTNDLDEMCIWLETNLPHKTLETIERSSLEELGKCLDDNWHYQTRNYI